MGIRREVRGLEVVTSLHGLSRGCPLWGATREGPDRQSGAFENTSAKRRTRHSHESDLALAPGEIEARGQFELIGLVSKVIRDCTPTGVAEEAHWTPNSLRFDTTAVAEREESGMILHHGVGNNYGAAG